MMSILPGSVNRLPARKVAVSRQLISRQQVIRPMSRILYYIVCTILAVFFIFPIFWSVFTSFKPPADASASPPNVIPSHVTVALFAFFNSWNEFLAALIFMSDNSKHTLPIMLLSAQSGLFGSIDWGALQAGVAIAMFPCLVLFLLLQKYYINGLVAGSVKG